MDDRVTHPLTDSAADSAADGAAAGVAAGAADAVASKVPAPRGSGPVARRRASELDLARRQLDAVDAWHRRRRMQEQAEATGQRSREQRLDLARRLDVIREQHQAIVARTDQQLRTTAEVLRRTSRPRLLVVHRNAWFVDKVLAGLSAAGVDLVGRLTNGAEAVGVAVAEQPELFLVEDSLPMLPGQAVVQEVSLLAPRTAIAAQVAHDSGIAGMLQAGARVAYARRVPPADVAAGLLGLLVPSSA